MCGIVGYIGSQDASKVILNGLRSLEYRGYDSAGICTLDGGEVGIRRSAGKLVNLERLLQDKPLHGSIGIGHTRWATHGKPTVDNAHPHRGGSVVVVHNGIIENYAALKFELMRKGRTFASQTDSEVISHLIDEHLQNGDSLEAAVRNSLQMLRGSYALCVLCNRDKRTMIAAKCGSPMVIGIGNGECFVASDIPAILANTRDIHVLEDEEMAVFREGAVSFFTINGETIHKEMRHIDWSPQMAEKCGFRHFMLKEIHEQPQAIRNTLAGRLLAAEGDVSLEHLNLDDATLASFEKICFVACGTSWHAALVGKYLIEKHCRIPVEVDIASEFRYRDPLISARTLVVPVSQSGETADTLAALREAKQRNGRVVSICNVVDSSIARESDGVVYTHAGIEIGVASTKAFVTQLVAMHLLMLRLGRANGTIDRDKGRGLIADLAGLPALVEKTLKLDALIDTTAALLSDARDAMYLGRGAHFPIALEGALKLKEISYVHADGYPAGEMKHGPIALIDSDMPVFVLAPRDKNLPKICSNMEEVIARGGRVIVLHTEGDEETGRMAEARLGLPECSEDLSPVLYAVVLQLVAYSVAVARNRDVDQPRNLAKSVTVE